MDGRAAQQAFARRGTFLRAGARRPRFNAPGAEWLAAPLGLFLLAFYAYPVGAMLARSVHPSGWSLAPYQACSGA